MTGVVLEQLKAAVNHRRIGNRSKCGPRYLEQDYNGICLVVVELGMGGERLEDVVPDHNFLDVSKVCPTCYEVYPPVKFHLSPHQLLYIRRVPVFIHKIAMIGNGKILLEAPIYSCRKALLNPRALPGNCRIRFHVLKKTKVQVNGGVDDLSSAVP